MKKAPFLFILLMLTMVSCQSKEEKANKLIKEKMYKTLYEFSGLSNRLNVFDPDLKKIIYQENTDDQE